MPGPRQTAFLIFDPGKMDYCHRVIGSDFAAVDFCEKVDEVLMPAQLWVVTLDLPRADFAQRLNLHAVDHRRGNPLAGTEPAPHREPHDLTILVLVAFVP